MVSTARSDPRITPLTTKERGTTENQNSLWQGEGSSWPHITQGIMGGKQFHWFSAKHEDIPSPRGAEQIASCMAEGLWRNTFEGWKAGKKHTKDENFHLTFRSEVNHPGEWGTLEHEGALQSSAYCLRRETRMLKALVTLTSLLTLSNVSFSSSKGNHSSSRGDLFHYRKGCLKAHQLLRHVALLQRPSAETRTSRFWPSF